MPRRPQLLSTAALAAVGITCIESWQVAFGGVPADLLLDAMTDYVQSGYARELVARQQDDAGGQPDATDEAAAVAAAMAEKLLAVGPLALPVDKDQAAALVLAHQSLQKALQKFAKHFLLDPQLSEDVFACSNVGNGSHGGTDAVAAEKVSMAKVT